MMKIIASVAMLNADCTVCSIEVFIQPCGYVFRFHAPYIGLQMKTPTYTRAYNINIHSKRL